MKLSAFIVGLLATLALSGLVSAADEDLTRQQIEALKRKITVTQSRLRIARGERSEHLDALKEVEVRIGKLSRDLANNKAAQNRQQKKLAELERKRADLKGKQRQQQANIAEQVRRAWSLGQERKIKLLLNQDDPQTLSRVVTYHDYFNRAHEAKLDEFVALSKELEQTVIAVIDQRKLLAATGESLKRQQNLLGQQQDKREKVIALLDQKISSQNTKLSSYQQERKELEQLLNSLAEELADLKLPANYRQFDRLRGAMPWPSEGRRLNAFGGKRNDSSLRWEGINIAAKPGTPVRAIHHGRVVFADWLRGSGLLIIIDHSDGYLSLYGHNESLLHSVGDWVKAGDQIATVGNSGGQSTAALYFEIRRNGKTLDPKRWCRG